MTGRSEFAQNLAIEKVLKALNEPGQHVAYHKGVWDECARSWPTLFEALDELLKANRMNVREPF